MPRRVAFVDAAFDLHNGFPGFRRFLSEEVLGVLNKQGVDVDHMALDQQVVRAVSQLDQGAGDDVDETPGEFAERGTVAFIGKLPGDAAGDFGDEPETTYCVIAGRTVGPAEVKDIEGVLPSAAPALHKHALEQIGIALGGEHDAGLTTADVLSDQQFDQAGFADAGGAEYEGVADPYAQRQADIDLIGPNAVQSRQAADCR